MSKKTAWLLAAGLLLATGCHRLASDKSLIITMTPPELKAGQMIEIAARPSQKVTLGWVSGTVKVFGAPVLPLKWDEHSGAWKFRTMLPVFASIPKGLYKVQAWGEDKTGGKWAGDLVVQVK